MKKLLFEKQILGNIIKEISEGGLGVDSNDFLIINSDEKYNQIIIKSCSIDITDKVIETIGDANLKIDGFENEILDFIAYTVVEEFDEENNQKQKNLYCMSLIELIIQNKDILSSSGWSCFSLSDNESVE